MNGAWVAVLVIVGFLGGVALIAAFDLRRYPKVEWIDRQVAAGCRRVEAREQARLTEIAELEALYGSEQ